MDAVLAFYGPNEFFIYDGGTIVNPIGTNFIDFIELDSMNELANYTSMSNPYFKLFENYSEFERNTNYIIETIDYFKDAARIVLSTEIDELKDLDTDARCYLFEQCFHKDFFQTKINHYFAWVFSEDHPQPDPTEANKLGTVVLDFNNKEQCHEIFKTLADSVKESVIQVNEQFHVQNLKEALFVSFMHMVKNQVVLKKCKCCGKYFIPTGRADKEYCDRIAPNSSKTCYEVGSIKKYHEKTKSNPVLQLFQKEYKKINARIRAKRITQEQFFNWSTSARSLRDEAVSKDLSVEEFKQKLDELTTEILSK
ncbi:DUF6076 domain-containing protein [Desulfosporosinus sp. FKB]|uniref:DUF6076 domain-containing protein n=1 Tax=Desulfosporosinus sp. FKB TaxID=1969835 RepID=UPI000B49F995|nr:DUF6076 domain-containing protein [Desulfosporosinus sp. FKB]